MSMTSLSAREISQKCYRYDRVHTPIARTSDITDEHVREYWDRGFIAVEKVFTPEEVAEYSQAITDLIANGDPSIIEFERGLKVADVPPAEREGLVRKCMCFVQKDSRLKAMSEHPTLQATMKRLLNSPVRLIQDMALLKPPGGGREKPWHQDMAYFNYSPPEKVIGTWTALDAATAANGAMHMIPGSHRDGPRPHYHDRDCQLDDEEVEVDRDVIVPLSPGGVLFFSALIHHGTPANHSTQRRRAIQLHYCAEDCRKIETAEHLKMFHDSVGYAGCVWHADGTKPRPMVSRPEKI